MEGQQNISNENLESISTDNITGPYTSLVEGSQKTHSIFIYQASLSHKIFLHQYSLATAQ